MSVVYVLAKPAVNLDLSVLRNLSTYKTYEEEPNIQQMREFLRRQLIHISRGDVRITFIWYINTKYTL